MQDCSNSIALTMELLRSCTKPSLYGITRGQEANDIIYYIIYYNDIIYILYIIIILYTDSRVHVCSIMLPKISITDLKCNISILFPTFWFFFPNLISIITALAWAA